MSDCVTLKHFLGMKIEVSNGILSISQESSIQNILSKFCLLDCNAAKTPMEKGLQLPMSNSDAVTDIPYRELLGLIMYLMLCSRPISYVGRFQQNPFDLHCQHLKGILRYLKVTKAVNLTYQSNEIAIVGYVDADWVSDILDRKSASGFVCKVYGSTVSWSSKKQQTVAIYSSEAEYVALSAERINARFQGNYL